MLVRLKTWVAEIAPEMVGDRDSLNGDSRLQPAFSICVVFKT